MFVISKEVAVVASLASSSSTECLEGQIGMSLYDACEIQLQSHALYLTRCCIARDLHLFVRWPESFPGEDKGERRLEEGCAQT